MKTRLFPHLASTDQQDQTHHIIRSARRSELWPIIMEQVMGHSVSSDNEAGGFPLPTYN